MQRSAGRLIRFPSFVRRPEAAAQPAGAGTLTKEQQEKLRGHASSLVVRSGERAPRSHPTGGDTLDLLTDVTQDQKDAIRARGVAKYAYSYSPPSNAETLVLEAASRLLQEEGALGEEKEKAERSNNLSAFSFAFKNALKFKVLLSVSKRFDGHLPLSDRLVYITTVQDVVDFYTKPVSNINEYVKLARGEEGRERPENLHVLERPSRFHPEDKEAFHGGITAFPGTGGRVFGLRNQRLLRQFRPKEHWFDYEQETFDYERPDANMPWDPEMIKKMDSFTDKKYNFNTKKFTRTSKDKTVMPE